MFNIRFWKRGFPFYQQLESTDCGTACLKMILKYYGQSYSIGFLNRICNKDKDGVTLRGISEACKILNLSAIGLKVNIELCIAKIHEGELKFPFIAYWNKNHFVIVYKFKSNKFYIADPALGKVRLTKEEFTESWIMNGKEGVLLSVYPDENFKVEEKVKIRKKFLEKIKTALPLLGQNSSLLIISSVSLLYITLISFLPPIFTKLLIDLGIGTGEYRVVFFIISSQLILLISIEIFSFFQSWASFLIYTKLSISLKFDFFQTLFNGRMNFIKNRSVGDILNRVQDHERITSFLTESIFTFILSLSTFFVYSLILFSYDKKLFFFSFLGGAVYYGYIIIFFKLRRFIDNKVFSLRTQNENKVLELINGFFEIKLLNSEKKRLNQWRDLQFELYKVTQRFFMINQIQSRGGNILMILVTSSLIFISVIKVLKGEFTFGTLLSVQFIIGQTAASINQLIYFFQNAQDAQISYTRVNDFKFEIEEEPLKKINFSSDVTIKFENVNFRYGNIGKNILKDLNFEILPNSVNAIVGESGSGKTTILNLILGIENSYEGKVLVNGKDLKHLEKRNWWDKLGVVSQDSYIFPDSFAMNICERDTEMDLERMILAAKLAMIHDFIVSLPKSYEEIIEKNGVKLSKGQRQRVLLARAIYMDPEIFILDEATNSLDSSLERSVNQNLFEIFKNKTSIVVTHRLSTILLADQIIVMKNGEISDIGTHKELIVRNKTYKKLFQNQ